MAQVGILTSGGDCAGLNAVIAAAVKAGTPLGYEFVGFIKGWEGLLSPMNFVRLDVPTIRGISHTGGTILQTVNKGRFGGKAGVGGRNEIPEEILDEAQRNLKAIGVEALIVIGGDGSLSAAHQLAERGVNIVGVPKTIDNDLQATDRTFGYSTAVQVVVDALDRIHTTATSHNRVIFVETMGRHAGWIALRAGLAGGAHAILLPEFPFQIDDFVAYLRERNRKSGYSVVCVAEGALVNGELSASGKAGTQEVHLGGIADKLAHAVEQLAPGEFDTRVTVLGHVQRGGTPNAADRMLARAYGAGAIQAVHEGRFNTMVCYHDLKMQTVPLESAVGALKLVTDQAVEYNTARQLGVFIH